MNETYFDPSFGGLDWKIIHDSYKPQIASTENDKDFYALINKMLWELKVSHAAFIPPGFLAAVEPVAFAEGGIGINVRMLDGKAVITSVDPESPDHKAGLRPGFIIQPIDGIPIAQIEMEVKKDRLPYSLRGRLDGLPVFCAQIVPKICQEYQNVSNNIELYRNPECPKNGLVSVELIYYLLFTFFRRFLHTVEVRGSIPLSPTSPYPRG